MENATKAILFGAAIVITLVLVSLGFLLLNNATGSVNQQVSDMEQQKQQVLDQKYTKYDGKTVSGSEVLNALEEFKDEGIAVKIDTLSAAATDYLAELDAQNKLDATSTGSAIAAVYDPSDEEYVNPSGKFKGTVLRDPNKTITGILFAQQ